MSQSQFNASGIVLAGGKGTRLGRLTDDRAKPAVYFGAEYRIIDFVMSNLVNSGLGNIDVIIQYKGKSLNAHLSHTWAPLFSLAKHETLEVLFPDMEDSSNTGMYTHTAHAVFKNLERLSIGNHDYVAVFGGDHVYRMDVRQMLGFHESNRADLTIAAIPVKKELADQFGIIVVDENGRILDFQEKPSVEEAKTIPGDPEHVLASMGNYIFNGKGDSNLEELLRRDASLPQPPEGSNGKYDRQEFTRHDFGGDVIPRMLKEGMALFAYDFNTNRVPGATEREVGYWRDVGTVASYFAANMEVKEDDPVFSLYNQQWPITHRPSFSKPGVKCSFGGYFTNSIVGAGSIIAGARIIGSVLSSRIKVDQRSQVKNSIIFPGVYVGEDVEIQNSIIDKENHVPDGEMIGFDPRYDRERGLYVERDSGITIVPKGHFPLPRL